MVKIVNGELLSDNDIRLRNLQQSHHNINTTHNTIQHTATPLNNSISSSTSTSAISNNSTSQYNINTHTNTTAHQPEQYLLFGLPAVTVENIQILPHIYLPVFLAIYVIGTKAFIFALATAFFYRWHIKQRMKHQQQFNKLQQSHYTTTMKQKFSTPKKPVRKLSDIHTIHDIPQQYNTAY